LLNTPTPGYTDPVAYSVFGFCASISSRCTAPPSGHGRLLHSLIWAQISGVPTQNRVNIVITVCLINVLRLFTPQPTLGKSPSLIDMRFGHGDTVIVAVTATKFPL